MDDNFIHKEPIIVVASEESIAVTWAAKHLNSFARRPICKGLLQVECTLTGLRGKVIILVDIPNLGPHQYRGTHNTIITLRP